jgi:hypothetical protein
MNKRAGLLFLAKDTRRILLILDDAKWTVPTFSREKSLIEDSKNLTDNFSSGKLIPIELYLSNDKGFEYGTYICVVNTEFSTLAAKTIAWCSLDDLPKQLHLGLKATLNNQIIKTKINTIVELLEV